MENYELTILMPCLNEAETLAECIRKAKYFLNEHNVQGEVLIADNGSTDGSQQIAASQGARVLSVPTKGYGAALKQGMLAAKGRYVIMGDADDSYNFLHLQPLLTKLREGYELVMGNRFKGGITAGAMPLLNRYLGNPVLSFIGRILFNRNVGDFHCGLRGFLRQRMVDLALKGDGMEFASEMVIKASLSNLKITEVPIQLYPDGRSREPHLRPWRDGWRHLRLLLLFSPKWIFFYPGLTLISMGLLLLSLLFSGRFSIGAINFDIHTMLFASLFIILGLQAVCFAQFAKVIAAKYITKDLQQTINQRYSLEIGLSIGSLLMLGGAIGSAYSLWFWSMQAFGPLEPTHMMRILIPAITCLITGGQVMFASFFLSLLKLHVQN